MNSIIKKKVCKENLAMPKNVTFGTVSIHYMHVWLTAYKLARQGNWHQYATDRDRFKRRINRVSNILDRVLKEKYTKYISYETMTTKLKNTFKDYNDNENIVNIYSMKTIKLDTNTINDLVNAGFHYANAQIICRQCSFVLDYYYVIPKLMEKNIKYGNVFKHYHSDQCDFKEENLMADNTINLPTASAMVCATHKEMPQTAHRSNIEWKDEYKCQLMVRYIAQETETIQQEKKEVNDEEINFIDDDETICVICTCKKRDTKLFPCEHYISCGECTAKLNSQCPVCRAKISSVLKIEEEKV